MCGYDIPHVVFQNERQHRITNHLGLKRLWKVAIHPPAQSRGSSAFRRLRSFPRLAIKISRRGDLRVLRAISDTVRLFLRRGSIFLYIQSDILLFQLKTIASHYPTMQVTLFLVISS